LDALGAQAEGLQKLGVINPIAETIIDIRRVVDKALWPAVIAPPIYEALKAAQKILKLAQKLIGVAQKTIKDTALTQAAFTMTKPTKESLLGHTKETFGPKIPLLPHGAPGALLLHVTEKKGYEKEDGAPLVLDSDFEKRQVANGTITIYPEKFLPQWGLPSWMKQLPKVSPVTLQCGAKIFKMKSLEDPWEVRLIPQETKSLFNKAKPWLRRLSPSP